MESRDEMNCPNCGAQNDTQAAFCKDCGASLAPEQEVAAGTVPEFDPSLNQPRKRKTALTVGTVLAVVVIGAGVTFAAVAQPFASGKALLLKAAQNVSLTKNYAKSAKETWHIELKNLSAGSLGMAPGALLSTLNGSTIDLDMLYLPVKQQAQVDFTTQYQSVSHKGSLWVSKDQLVLSAADYESLLALAAPGLKVPKYLVTDSQQTTGIQDFWSKVNKAPTNITPAEDKAFRDLEVMFVQAIPNSYIHRKGLASIDISFDQKGLEDILQSEVKAAYSNKARFTDDVFALAPLTTLPSGETPATLKQSILQGMSQMPVEAVLGGISTALISNIVTIQPTALTMSKHVFGSGYETSLTGGIAVSYQPAAIAGTILYQMDASSPATGTVTMPKVDSGNSQTFTNWSQSMGQ